MLPSAGPKRMSNSRPAPLACTECRLRHVKCDGKLPHCSRCLASNASCQYLKSRRGGKRKQKTVDTEIHHVLQDALPTLAVEPVELQLSQLSQLPQTPENEGETRGPGSQAGSYSATAHDDRNAPASLSPCSRESSQDHESEIEMSRIKLYYEHFHKAHPILLPEGSYYQRQYPRFLTTVVVSIGGRFSATEPGPTISPSSVQQLIALDDKSVCSVQAKLLQSIALWGEGSMDEAKVLFVSARDLAIELGMNRSDSLCSYSASFRGQELEGLRRTWWEIYILDGYMTAIWPEMGFLTNTLACDIQIPQDETEYLSNQTNNLLPAHRFSHDFLLTDDDERTLSAWWYRIQAAGLLAKVVLLDRPETNNDKSEATMAALASWRLSLPQDKAQFMDPFGRVNELLFEAEVLAQAAAIILHFPRSDLSSDLAITTPVSSIGSRPPIRSCTKRVHGIKATEASKEICNLFSLYPSMERCSPLLIPCLALCGMVQLATYQSHSQFGNCRELHGERVRLLTGLLRSASQIWGQAKTAHSELKRAAVETFHTPKDRSLHSATLAPNHTSYSGVLTLLQQDTLFSVPLSNAGVQDMNPWPWVPDPVSQILEPGNAIHQAGEYQIEI